MDTTTQDLPGPYVWSVPDKSVAVHLDIEVLERLGNEVMRGFGAVPKRGAEVGGLLLGTIEAGEQTIVRIEDFEPVSCGYKRGPSYLLMEEDGRAFADACRHWEKDSGKSAYAVGFYRSNTRDGLKFAPEDVELMNHYFPESSDVALLIRPNATKASTAGFFVREEGVFPETTPLEFPFRRWDLTGEEPPAHRPMSDRPTSERRRERAGPELVRTPKRDEAGGLPATAGGFPVDGPPAPRQEVPALSNLGLSSPQVKPAGRQIRWMWMPTSFMFLLLGVALGVQTSALFLGSKGKGMTTAEDFSLSLSIAKSGDNLTVKWNRNAPAIRAARRGVLDIDDGDSSPAPVSLDLAHLENGTMIYRNSSKTVRFKLTVFESSDVTVTEKAEWP
jgi:hypothetical protein